MKFFERATAGAATLGSIAVDPNFHIGSADAKLKGQSTRATPLAAQPAPLLPLFASLQGNFAGIGFNTIFRPNSLGGGGTTLPTPVNSTNILELNLMSETLSFSAPVGNIPNRGLDPQPDIFLSGLPYLQVINDVSNTQTGRADGSPIGIHFEPGMFVHVPNSDQNPVENNTINRIGSIPHGTTINAQGLEPTQQFPGGPRFANVDITPVSLSSGKKIPFASQTASNSGTPRLPQDLTKFIQAGTITQPILDNPNTVLSNAIVGQTIDNTVVFVITTAANQPIIGGGTANNGFLTGGSPGPNAFAALMNATFWIETVNWTVTVPAGSKSGQSQLLTPVAPNANVLLPTFSVTPPRDINAPTNITAQSTQIQYSQLVVLNFGGLGWPHASVNTLTQQGNINVPSSAFN